MTWQDDLNDNGVMMKESAVISALSSGANEKAELAGTTVSIQESDFCTSLDSAICDLAPSFMDNNEVAFSSDLAELCSAAGYNTVVYGAPASAIILKNGGVRFNADYVAQRKDILGLFVTLATTTGYETITIHADDCMINKSMEPLYIVTTPAGARDTIVWSSSDDTVATVDSNNVVQVHKAGTVTLTATSQKDNTVYGTKTINCAVCSDSNNVVKRYVHDLVATGNQYIDYTTNGIVVTYNSDGSITLNGTVGSWTKVRIGLWPTNYWDAKHIHLTSALTQGNFAFWIEPISGTMPSAGRYNTEHNHSTIFSIYCVNGNTTVSEMIHYTYESLQEGRRYGYIQTSNTDVDITGLIMECNLVPSDSTFENFTFKCGFVKFSNQVVYNGELLENYLAPINHPIFPRNTKQTGMVRLDDGSFEIATTLNKGVYNISQNNQGSFRLTNELLCSSNINSRMTGDTIGTIGNSYVLTVKILHLICDIRSATKLLFNLIGTNYSGTSTDFLVINDSDYTVDKDNEDFSGKTYKFVTTLTDTIDHIGMYYNTLAILGPYFTFALSMEELIPTQSLSFVHKPLFMINEGRLETDITPSNANAGIKWTVTDGGNNTFDNGNITVSEYASATINVTANDDNSLTDSATVTMCKVDKENDNAVANAVAISGLTYTQNGVTMTHNADGTITLNGTTTSGDTSYVRFVIWPIGNQKAARNIDLLELSPLAESYSPFAVWYEYVSGDVDFTKSTLSVSGHGTKAFEIYYMMTSTQFDSKIENYVNGSGDRQDCDIHSLDLGVTYLSAIVFGYQMKKGTTFDHFTFKVGLSMANPSSSEFYPSSMLDECLLEPYHFNIIDYSSCMLARYYSGLFTLWVSNVSYNMEVSFCKQTTTPIQIGEVGHTYRFVAHIVTIKFSSCMETSDAFMRFELHDSSGNIMGSTDIYTPGAVCSNTYWTNITRTIELTLTAPIADVVLHWYDTRIAQNHNKFYFTFEEITE